MSLVRSADSSSSYGSNLCTLGRDSDAASTSKRVSSSDKLTFNYGPELYSCVNYNWQYSSSPSDECSSQKVGFLRTPDLVSSQTMFHSQGSTCNQLMGSPGSSVAVQNPYDTSPSMALKQNSSFANIIHQSTFSTDFSSKISSDHVLDYDENEIRSKIQELERELLNDNDDDWFGMEQEMCTDGDWCEPIKKLLLSNSPIEPSSPNPNDSSISGYKEVPFLPMSSLYASKKLLFDCAAAIAEGHIDEASTIVAKLRQMVSIQGDPPQRIAAYMVEGLAARMAASGQGLYKALKCKEPPTSDRLSAMQILFEVCPCFKFGFMAANGAIAEAFKDERSVHIIDFDINQGSQYITLIQDMASRPSKPPHLRITGIDDPESVQRAVGGLKIIGQRLEKLAEGKGLPFEFRAIAAKTADVTPSMLECQPNEALIVNFAFQLHHLPDESVSTVNLRDQLLRMVKSLKPKLVTVVEQDVNTNTAPFLQRFVEAYNYYSAVFDSLDATLPRESPDRINVERHCLARDIVNIVACEGEDRIERYEVAGKWRARMTMAGFVRHPLSANVNGAIRSLLKSYCDRYKVKEEVGELHFGWENKILIVASAWR